MNKLVKSIAIKTLPDPVYLWIRFVVRHRYLPNLLSPRTFSEKVLAKMLFDRRPMLTVAADKLRARDFIAETIGTQYLPKLYAVWTSPDQIVLQPDWGSIAIKANQGSGFVKLVPCIDGVDIHDLRVTAARWLATNYGRQTGEWCYKDIKPAVFAEEMLGDGDPDKLIDYKIFCFSGRPGFVKIIKGMKGRTKSFYANLKFEDLHVSDGQEPLEIEHRKVPLNYDLMLDLASRLSSGFDMLRIDMYNINGAVYLGELTNYPLGAALRLDPRSRDLELGGYWALETMTYLPRRRRRRSKADWQKSLRPLM